jgi:hypothetical protein
LIGIADGEKPNSSLKAQEHDEFMQRMAEILVFVDE